MGENASPLLQVQRYTDLCCFNRLEVTNEVCCGPGRLRTKTVSVFLNSRRFLHCFLNQTPQVDFQNFRDAQQCFKSGITQISLVEAHHARRKPRLLGEPFHRESLALSLSAEHLDDGATN